MSPSPAEPVRTAAGSEFDPRAARAVLLILAVMALMVTYVETMVLPAFKQFYTFFDGAPYTTIAWILSAYLLVGTVATPIFGKLGDKYGKKRMLLIVMSIYAAAVSVAGFTRRKDKTPVRPTSLRGWGFPSPASNRCCRWCRSRPRLMLRSVKTATQPWAI